MQHNKDNNKEKKFRKSLLALKILLIVTAVIAAIYGSVYYAKNHSSSEDLSFNTSGYYEEQCLDETDKTMVKNLVGKGQEIMVYKLKATGSNADAEDLPYNTVKDFYDRFKITNMEMSDIQQINGVKIFGEETAGYWFSADGMYSYHLYRKVDDSMYEFVVASIKKLDKDEITGIFKKITKKNRG